MLYLRSAVARCLGQLLLQLDVVQLGAEQLHRQVPVLQLASLLRAEYADTRGLVDEIHRGFNLARKKGITPAPIMVAAKRETETRQDKQQVLC